MGWGCYTRKVRRVVLAIIVGILSLTASGVASLVVDEPCAIVERSGGEDGACPPTCVTCGCCAQAVEPSAFTVAVTPDAPIADSPDVLPSVLRNTSRDILHVPKPRLA
jgi:hypothetical protein